MNISFISKYFWWDNMVDTETQKTQQNAADKWAEEHGILEYRVQGWYLIYNVSYPAYLKKPRRTYQFKIDLRNGRTVESKQLKRYDPKGIYNRR